MENDPQDTDRRIDEALAESFPASDPPFFVGAGAQVPTVRKPKPRGEFYESFGRSPHTAIKH